MTAIAAGLTDGVRLFITGTDTEVGKTTITGCLARAARARGQTVWALKPVASGVPANAAGDDAVYIASAADHAPASHVRLTAPLSPHRAATLEDRAIDPVELRAWVARHTADVVLVEGVGGWRVPLRLDYDAADLAADLRAPVIVVAADRLGVINHTLLTVDAVRSRGLHVALVVLNRLPGPSGPSRAYNYLDLQELAGAPVVAVDAHDTTNHPLTRQIGDRLWTALRED